MTHILTNCKWVFEEESKLGRENRFTWRHNCVLRTLAEAIRMKLEHVNLLPPSEEESKGTVSQPFVKAGARVRKNKPASEELGLLASARDWVSDFDLPEYHRSTPFIFPHEVCLTTSRIDAFILSRSKRICIAGPELTVPMEENALQRHLDKEKRYEHLLSDKADEWTVHRLVLEVGCRGVVASSFFAALRKLGFRPSELRVLRDNCAYIARRCSYVIWLYRNSRTFSPSRLFHDGSRVRFDLEELSGSD
jgi:hypothetical protein